MRILLDPDPPFVRWCRASEKGLRAGRAALGPRLLAALLRGGAAAQRASSIGYRLHHGGDVIRRPALRTTPEILSAVRDTVRLLPEHNELTFQAMRLMMRTLPDVPHVLLCDTAFFLGLPPAAGFYAVPAALRGRGARRYGGRGLLHEWAWRKASGLCGGDIPRLVSVELGDRPNAAALKDGRPVDTTMGFTPVEGILSRTSCGDIDASVVFELQSSGMSLSEINELLCARSGFQALAGRRCGFSELLRASGEAGKALARRMLTYNIVKYVGAFAAVLGGLDALVFCAQDPEASAPLLRAVCRKLEFLGLSCDGIGGGRAQAAIFSKRGSRVKAVALRAEAWRVLSERAAAVEEED